MQRLSRQLRRTVDHDGQPIRRALRHYRPAHAARVCRRQKGTYSKERHMPYGRYGPVVYDRCLVHGLVAKRSTAAQRRRLSAQHPIRHTKTGLTNESRYTEVAVLHASPCLDGFEAGMRGAGVAYKYPSLPPIQVLPWAGKASPLRLIPAFLPNDAFLKEENPHHPDQIIQGLILAGTQVVVTIGHGRLVVVTIGHMVTTTSLPWPMVTTTTRGIERCVCMWH